MAAPRFVSNHSFIEHRTAVWTSYRHVRSYKESLSEFLKDSDSFKILLRILLEFHCHLFLWQNHNRNLIKNLYQNSWRILTRITRWMALEFIWNSFKNSSRILLPSTLWQKLFERLTDIFDPIKNLYKNSWRIPTKITRWNGSGILSKFF